MLPAPLQSGRRHGKTGILRSSVFFPKERVSHSKDRTKCYFPRNYICGLYVNSVTAALGNTFSPTWGRGVCDGVRREDAVGGDELLQGEREVCRYWEMLRDKFLPRWPCCHAEVALLLQLPT